MTKKMRKYSGWLYGFFLFARSICVGQSSADCLTCHSDLSQIHTTSPHRDFACVDCHTGFNPDSIPHAPNTSANLAASCGTCHSDVNEDFAASAHGRALAGGVQGAPDCISCHKNNITTAEAGGDSLAASKIHQEKLCLSCHLYNDDVRGRTTPSAGFIAAYEQSVHGSALLKGNGKAANCVDCHGSHQMKKGFESSSKMNRAHIPETCAKCHGEIAKEFAQSVHGVAVANGNQEAPVCTNCHGEHTIYKHNDPRSPVASKNVSREVCSPCHSSVALSAKYGLATDRFTTFSDSYHGLAMSGGSIEAANCASCHGSHSIKSSADSTSMVNKANLAVTCGKCHPGANARFAVGSVHLDAAARSEDPILEWIARTYIVLIVVVIGGMLIHNVLDFYRKSKRKLQIRRGVISHEEYGHSLYIRMTLSERLQHAALLVSFIALVITGFMLRFPDTWWVQAIRRLSDNVFEARSIVHRIAAVVMVGASLLHVFYLAFTPRGRELFRALLPSLQDARDAAAVMKFNLGFSRTKPKFGRFSYIEKSEYWALVWGTMIMAGTGAIMWFDNISINTVTKLGYDISREIHYYEAWLATLAIVVWHIYFVIFNPDVYPVNLAFWTGTLTEEEMSDEHPLELESLQRKAMEEDLNNEDKEKGNA